MTVLREEENLITSSNFSNYAQTISKCSGPSKGVNAFEILRNPKVSHCFQNGIISTTPALQTTNSLPLHIYHENLSIDWLFRPLKVSVSRHDDIWETFSPRDNTAGFYGISEKYDNTHPSNLTKISTTWNCHVMMSGEQVGGCILRFSVPGTT